jgi:hypothetical protein
MSTRITSCALVFLVSGVALFAQTPTGTIKGLVVDQSGGAVPNASVEITQASTNETHQQKTDSSGGYTQPFLTPGTYVVSVKATGFAPLKQENVVVEVAEIRPVNFTLQVGNVSSTVEVQATTPPLQTDSATMGTVIDTRDVLDLPLNGRNPFALAELVPGVNNVGNASTPHIGGSRNAVNEEELDGVTNILPENNVGNTTGAYTPVIDSVQEFNVQTNSLSAEYGRFGGGVINLVTKQGTNQLHGDGFFFARNGILDANDFFSNSAGGSAPSMYRYQTGATIGGPVVIPHLYNGRNKSFFFIGFQDSREADLAVATETVPTVAERAGNFAGVSTIYNPYTPTQATINGTSQYVRSQFTNNQIPASLLNPVALAALAYFPLPNVTGNSSFNYSKTGTSGALDDKYDTRFDQNFSDKWHMFLRFSHDWNSNTYLEDYGNAASTGGNGPSAGGAWSASLDNTFTFSPTLIGDFRYGISRSYVTRAPFGQGFNPTSLGLPGSIGSLAAAEDLQFPDFNINNTPGLGASGYVYLVENPFAHQATGTLTKIAGAHTFKMGAEFRQLYINFTQYGQPDGQFNFDNTWTQQLVSSGNGTGNPIASFLLGLPTGGQITHDPTAASSSRYMGYYFQDDWKVSRKLTVNLGLRWDVEFPRTERYNRLSYFNPTAVSPLQGLVPASACLYCGNLRGAMEFAGDTGQYGRAQGPTQWKDFGPRVGIAYLLTPTTVLRSGFGIAYLPSALEAAGTDGASGMDGFATSTNLEATLNNYVTPYATLSNPFPNGFHLPTGTSQGALTFIGQGISDTFFDSYRNPYTIQWNFNIQQQLPGKMSIEVGYLGNKSLFLVNGDPGVPYSQAQPQFLALGSQLLQQVANPFYGIITDPTSPLSQKTVSYYQLLSPFPQYNGVQAFRKPDAASFYNAVTVRINKQLSNGLSFLLSYTGAKMLDNSAAAVTYLGPQSGTYTNQYNPKLEWAVSPQDVSQDLVGSFVYELPFGRGKQFASNAPKFVNTLISGWQANGIITWSTGTPIVLTGANTTLGLGNPFPQPPDTKGGDSNVGNPTINQWFNTSQFYNPPAFTFGNVSRTLPNVRSPSYTDADISLFKNNYFGSENRYNLQFRIEAFNSLNHENFGTPDQNINDANFGKITSTNSMASPRQVQLAAKFYF